MPNKRTATKPAPVADRPASGPAPDPQLDLFGRAVTATQQKRWREAASLFRLLLAEIDDDPSLGERARQYLSLCEQRLSVGNGGNGGNGDGAEPDEDPYLQAVVAKNRGDFAAALALCRRGGRHHRDERMAYLAASILALEGAIPESAELLARAVEQDARNRVLAFHDSDFAGVLDRAEFAFVLGTS